MCPLFTQLFFTSFPAREKSFLGIFRMWQNILLNKVQLCPVFVLLWCWFHSHPIICHQECEKWKLWNWNWAQTWYYQSATDLLPRVFNSIIFIFIHMFSLADLFLCKATYKQVFIAWVTMGSMDRAVHRAKHLSMFNLILSIQPLMGPVQFSSVQLCLFTQESNKENCWKMLYTAQA